MLRNLDTIYDIARSSKNFSTGINFSKTFFLVYRGLELKMRRDGPARHVATRDHRRTSALFRRRLAN